MIIKEDELYHYGTPRRSGRYPWGSGEDPYQSEPFLRRYESYRKAGLTEAESAKLMGMTTTQMRAQRAIERNSEYAAKMARVAKLSAKGYSVSAIGREMGVNESTVRSWLDPSRKARAEAATVIAENLKKTAGKDAVDVGKGVERYLGYSQDKLKVALAMLEKEGYKVDYIYTKSGSDHHTPVKVLLAPGVTTHDIYQNRDRLKSVAFSLEDPVEGGAGIKKPAMLDSKRLEIRYAENGGLERDGTMLIRPGAKDLELGGSHYAQVRINVDNSHYLKGMAMYGDPKDFPPGKDIIFSTNKKKGTPLEGVDDNSVLKPMKMKTNKDGSKSIDWDNPFGATIDPIKGQYMYTDSKTGKKKQSLINKVNDEGSWDTWSKTLSSQMLSKQDISLAKKQLGIDLDHRRRDYDEINNLTNPVVKQNLLKTFADECDSAAVHLKAAAMPRQRTQVILPIPSLKDTEIYAPNFRNGEHVVLIRYPHGGRFEIPELVVNNRNKKASAALSGSKDCVGINAHVAERLSGADFDGDNVLVIPNNHGEIKTHSALAGLKNFDPKTAYPAYPGMKHMSKKMKQKQMGIVSNLITDMTIKGAPWSDIEKAVRHSMVVIDAEKHNLNWKQSERDNNIDLLKQKWQQHPETGKYGGVSTLISKASSELRVPDRKLRSPRHGGPIDPKTGELIYENTGKKIFVPAKRDKNGHVLSYRESPKLIKTTKMAEAKNAYSLSSGTKMESVYAEYANSLKGLANRARKSYLRSGTFKYSPESAKRYSKQVSSLKAKLNIAEKNRPLERKAELLSDSLFSAKKAAHPEYDASDLKKLNARCLADARMRVGAKKHQINITDDEWEAIQNRAISKNLLQQILQNADQDRVKQLATPKQKIVMSPSMVSRAKSMLSRGYTQAEVADRLGVSVSTIANNVGK